MKPSRHLVAIAFVALGISAIAPLASAAPVAGRDTRTGDLYVSGLTGYQSVKSQYDSLPKSTNKNANECGVIKLSATSSTLPIAAGDSFKLNGGADVPFDTLPVEAEPKCTNGALAGNTTPSAALKDSNGNVYFTGLTAFAQNSVTYNNVPTVRSGKASTCGILRLSNSGNYVGATGTVNITDRDSGATIITIDTATVPSVSGGPLCRNGATFTTADWPVSP